MTPNPPPNDFVKMQEQAIKRVREMQQKASPSQPVFQKENPPPPKIEIAKKSEIPKPENPSAAAHEKKPDQQENKSEEKQYNEKHTYEKSHNPFSGLLNMDADMSIVLPLIFFLGKEGADDVLILALLYIMS